MRGFLRAAACGLLGTVLLSAGDVSRAVAEDDEQSFDRKIINNVLNGLGLRSGGAVGNAIDRLFYGAVADFVLFHITTATWRFDWYVFNLADAAIVAGVIGLLYESLFGDHAAKAP